MMNKTLPRLLGALVCLLPGACTVAFWDYPRITAPDAEYINVGCNGDGPPKRAYYPFHGIFIAVELEPLLLSLHVPRKTQVVLDADPVVVTGQTAHGPVELTLPLKPAGQQAVAGSGTIVYDFDQRKDPWQPGQPNPDAIVDGIRQGNLRLPGITINGEHFPPQDLPFAHASWKRAMNTTSAACLPQQ